MSSSHDLKEALSQRLKRMESGTNSSTAASSMRPVFTRGNSFSPSSGSLLNHNEFGKMQTVAKLGTSSNLDKTNTQLPSANRFSLLPAGKSVWMPVAVSTTNVPAIECEGYLAKYSSGSLTARWQRRYFVLRGGRFGYYKKQPASSEVKADKTFSLRKIKGVFTKEPCGPADREFSLELGEHVYQLKATTPSDMRKWLSALSTAVAHKDSFPPMDEEENDSSGGDMMSVSNSVVSSVYSDASAMSEDVQAYLTRQRVLAAETAASNHSETVWEVEVDVDQLDVLFQAWFPSANEQVQMTISEINQSLVLGISKVVSHLYAVLANEVFDPDLVDLVGQFDRVKVSVEAIRKTTKKSSGTDPIKAQMGSVLMEYVPRVVQVVDRFLDKRVARRAMTSDDDDEEETHGDSATAVNNLPAIMGVLGGLISNLGVIWQEQCVCVNCDAKGVFFTPQEGACIVSDKWRKALLNLQQRISSEFEVCLIESIQKKMLSIEKTWDETVSIGTGPAKVTHALFGNRSGIWLTSWTSSLLVTCQERAVDILKNESPSFPRRLVSELVASVLVAVLNSAWRQFHRKSLRTNAFVVERKKAFIEAGKIAYANSGFWGAFTAGQTNSQILQILQIPIDEKNTLELANLLAFANEAVLVSIFLTESLFEQLPFIPKIFASCFEGLGITFVNSALETCNHIVYFHFTDKAYSESDKLFKPPEFWVKKTTPMQTCRDMADKFISDLVPFGAHPSVKNHCVNVLPFALVHLYVSGLIKQKPRIKVVKNNLVVVLQTDLIVFKALFSEQRFGGNETIVSQSMNPLHWILSFLTEPDVRILVDDLAPKLAAYFGPKHAAFGINALLEMRGGDLGKTDRTAMMGRVEGAVNTVRESLQDADNLPWRFN